MLPGSVTHLRVSPGVDVSAAKPSGGGGSFWILGSGWFSPAFIYLLRGLPTAFRHAISAWFDLLLLYSQQVISRLHPVLFLFVLLCLFLLPFFVFYHKCKYPESLLFAFFSLLFVSVSRNRKNAFRSDDDELIPALLPDFATLTS